MVTVSGLIYNLGLVVGPWFEGQLAQCLLGILNGNETFAAMAALCAGYLIAIAVVQGSRFIKRLYVRKFANNINRSMKQVLYANLVRKDKVELEQAGTGTLMTKAISDVDACAEGMRKFTTEIFDTGIALLAYAVMLLVLDDPFSALDRKTEEQVFANLRKMIASSTVLLISHRLYLFPQMDGVLWIQDGKAVCAAHEELMARNPQYAALVNAQEGGEQDEPEK